MNPNFDREEAKKFLAERENKEKEQKEAERKQVLQQVIEVLKEEFAGSSVEVYLVGSIIIPFRFSSRSDVDIVVKNYTGDRFDLWTKLEGKIDRQIEIIPFETCHFQESVLKDGLRVL